jgi:hypothetical protein
MGGALEYPYSKGALRKLSPFSLPLSSLRVLFLPPPPPREGERRGKRGGKKRGD